MDLAKDPCARRQWILLKRPACKLALEKGRDLPADRVAVVWSAGIFRKIPYLCASKSLDHRVPGCVLDRLAWLLTFWSVG